MTIKSEDKAQYNVSAEITFSGTKEDFIRQAFMYVEAQFYRLTDPLNSPNKTADYLKLYCAKLEHEIFGVICLDNRHQVIDVLELFRGTIDGAAVYPREVVKSVLAANAAAVIYFHNHPSGNPEPSSADRNLTKRLKECFNQLDIRSLDHIIVGGANSYSFAENGEI